MGGCVLLILILLSLLCFVSHLFFPDFTLTVAKGHTMALWVCQSFSATKLYSEAAMVDMKLWAGEMCSAYNSWTDWLFSSAEVFWFSSLYQAPVLILVFGGVTVRLIPTCFASWRDVTSWTKGQGKKSFLRYCANSSSHTKIRPCTLTAARVNTHTCLQ